MPNLPLNLKAMNHPESISYISDWSGLPNVKGIGIRLHTSGPDLIYLTGKGIQQYPTQSMRPWFVGNDALRFQKPRKFSTSLLLKKFTDDTRWYSSLGKIKKHPAFCELTSVGNETVSLILGRMAQGEVHVSWFPLLKSILAIDPVLPKHRGRTRHMASDWLRWARDNKILNA
jgi:hypothetical protein